MLVLLANLAMLVLKVIEGLANDVEFVHLAIDYDAYIVSEGSIQVMKKRFDGIGETKA